jgi:tetratricopeptide (TPR) repeat protein
MPQNGVEQLLTAAVQHHQAGRLTEAARAYQEVLAQKPDHPHALHLLGVVALQSGRADVATELISKAIALAPSCADFHSNLGNALRERGEVDKAIESYQTALRLNPQAADAWNNMGNALTGKGQIDAAIEAYRHALRLRPAYPDANNNLGSALAGQGKVEQAIACYRQALSLRPDYSAAWHNLANALRVTGQLEEAIEAYGQAIQLKPSYAEAWNGLSLAHDEKGDTEKAAEALEHALRLNPNLPDAHSNQAMRWLLHGDFERGWPEYEWRWKLKGAPLPQTHFVQPRWNGEDLNGRTILLYAEQGYGDTIQFIRYAPLVKQRGGRVMFVCMPEVARLLQNFSGVDEMVPPGKLPPFHLHCPLLSLPLVFKTRVETIPANVPYLKADAALAEQWSGKLALVGRTLPATNVHGGKRPPCEVPPSLIDGAAGALTGGLPADSAGGGTGGTAQFPRAPSCQLKVGLAWAGRPTHGDDRKRSIRLSQLAPLAQISGVTFFSLQKGDPAAESANPLAGMQLIDCAPDLHDFADTAALISQLDLVIAVDTAVAHLAGALGKPVWVLLPFKPDWRWLLNRNDSPWYPTMRLFRQSGRREWNEVIEEVCRALAEIFQATRS